MRTIMLMMAGWLLCMAASAQKETRIYQFDKPLYGAAYYAEYTPTNRLDEDIMYSDIIVIMYFDIRII